jgi:hypothetical protein
MTQVKEMPRELAEQIADWVGVYGSHNNKCTEEEPCRMCFTEEVVGRIRAAVQNEKFDTAIDEDQKNLDKVRLVVEEAVLRPPTFHVWDENGKPHAITEGTDVWKQIRNEVRKLGNWESYDKWQYGEDWELRAKKAEETSGQLQAAVIKTLRAMRSRRAEVTGEPIGGTPLHERLRFELQMLEDGLWNVPDDDEIELDVTVADLEAGRYGRLAVLLDQIRDVWEHEPDNRRSKHCGAIHISNQSGYGEIKLALKFPVLIPDIAQELEAAFDENAEPTLNYFECIEEKEARET